MPPLRRPRGASSHRHAPEDTSSPHEDGDLEEISETKKPIRPNFVRHAPERCPEEDSDDGVPLAAPSLVPKLSRPEYFCIPSIEAMSKMSEAKLARVDNLEIGRYGYGSIKWPGLTDVRRLNFDLIVSIQQGSLTLYPDRELPKIGQGLNKESVVTLNVKPSRSDVSAKNVEALQNRLAQISQDFGGKFISYDMEKWIFRLPHFKGLS